MGRGPGDEGGHDSGAGDPRDDASGKARMNATCVINNAVQRSSAFWGEHGLAFLIETEAGRVLFDTGQSSTVLLHNLELLGVDPATVDALAISHAHYDHTGGLPALLERVRPGTPLYANPDLFRERFSRRDGEARSIGLSLTKEELATRLTLNLSPVPQEIVPGVWTTGEISDRPDPEGSSANHLVREGDSFISDSYRDDMALVLEMPDRGRLGDRLALLCGCCHAGLLNTLAHVQRTFERPIAVIAGGLHLTSASADYLQRVGEMLVATESVHRVFPNHCTGESAFVALTLTLGPPVVRPCPAGTVVEFWNGETIVAALVGRPIEADL
jgi:7,8-dihydropterin-6-yl-methyl-4-(beta-D-ribofuranosyl)aminobenzene 5'-phosphate synthase